jgi:glycosyltransferase involved in cell wall biosynthesis
VLQARFADLDMEIVEVIDLLKGRRSAILGNVLPMLRYYGLDLLLGRKDSWNAFFSTPYAFRAIRRLVAERLSSREYVFTFQIQSLFDASQTGVPHFTYTDHTHLENLTYPAFDRRKLMARAWIDLEGEIYRNATCNLTWSTNISRSMIEDYGCSPSQVLCVYAGCNVLVEDAPLDNDGYRNKNILFIGIDWERKGGPDLVRAFEQVRRLHPDARLTIVGSAPKIAVPGCTVIGRVPLEEIPRHYSTASIFCMPTKREPFGIVFVEAMAHRLPVVGTRLGAIPDFVKVDETGYLVDTGAVDELARALTRLLDDPDRCRRFGEAGRRLVMERYTWDRAGDAIHAAISARLGGRI